MARESVFGTATLVLGPETLLAERAVARLLAAAQAEHPDVQRSELDGSRMSAADLLEAAGGSLFTSLSVVVVDSAQLLEPGAADALVALAAAPGDELCLVVQHQGGTKGRGVADRLRKAKVHVVEAVGPKAWELVGFVTAEARHAGVKMDQGAAQALIDAVGSDLRSLAAAVSQLASDWAGERLSVEMVGRYFAGRAEVSSFVVSDDVLAGHTGQALERLRWALSCGVAPVLITSALASSLRSLGNYLELRSSRLSDAEMARAVGAPPWKLKTLARQARHWHASAMGPAIVAVARADAAVKGAATDPEFALEQLLLSLDDARSA
ncbi:DNA polymerase III, delta subunit [Propionibacterium cyclohexanicum]|uniref:DNA-directed DNA polymerase n=1 Tax=Propionibacterium cyclohexanicum TaxID=64702 RepID=A0A1H9Q9R3_9ACTN|nr:DNA polymerase III subunit delta [Propionibacterium cyclohexanicum]SER56619.1 DNA polymerase III, delta subunit [Propionibacterium cyclohexanicum]